MHRQRWLSICLAVLAALLWGAPAPHACGSEPWAPWIDLREEHPEYFTYAMWAALGLGALSGLLAVAPARWSRGLLLGGAAGSLSGGTIGVVYYRAALHDTLLPEFGGVILAAGTLGLAVVLGVAGRLIRRWAGRTRGCT